MTQSRGREGMVNREGPSRPDRRWGGGQAGEERGPDELTGRQLTGWGKPLFFSQEFEDNFSSVCHGPSIVWTCWVKCSGVTCPGGKSSLGEGPPCNARVGTEGAFPRREAPERFQPTKPVLVCRRARSVWRRGAALHVWVLVSQVGAF